MLYIIVLKVFVRWNLQNATYCECINDEIPKCQKKYFRTQTCIINDKDCPTNCQACECLHDICLDDQSSDVLVRWHCYLQVPVNLIDVGLVVIPATITLSSHDFVTKPDCDGFKLLKHDKRVRHFTDTIPYLCNIVSDQQVKCREYTYSTNGITPINKLFVNRQSNIFIWHLSYTSSDTMTICDNDLVTSEICK